MLSNATIRDFLRFLDPFLGVFPAGVRMVVVVVANLPPTDSYKKSKNYLELKLSSLNIIFNFWSLKNQSEIIWKGLKGSLILGRNCKGKPDELEVVAYMESINQHLGFK